MLLKCSQILVKKDGGSLNVADANPEIQTVSDALARPDLFPHPEGDGGGLYTCPSGWNCQLSTGNLFRAFGGEEAGFDLSIQVLVEL